MAHKRDRWANDSPLNLDILCVQMGVLNKSSSVGPLLIRAFQPPWITWKRSRYSLKKQKTCQGTQICVLRLLLPSFGCCQPLALGVMHRRLLSILKLAVGARETPSPLYHHDLPHLAQVRPPPLRIPVVVARARGCLAASCPLLFLLSQEGHPANPWKT